jgi:hypothetical protein
MRWIDGVSLTHRCGASSRTSSITSPFQDAGEWLGNFHRIGPLREGKFNFMERRAHIGLMIANPIPHPCSSTAPQRSPPAVLSGIGGDSGKLATRGLQNRQLHDCKGSTYAIDLSLAHENAVEHDLAQFMNQLDMLLVAPSVFAFGIARARDPCCFLPAINGQARRSRRHA